MTPAIQTPLPTAAGGRFDAEADQALKATHRSVWASGDYPALAHEIIPSLGPILVDACRIRPGDRVLDVAAGAGNAAIPAALDGAVVVASDLTPELLDAGRWEATARGLDLDWREADAEALPFGDAQYDVVLSQFGHMFAPRPALALAEMLRVLKPGGRSCGWIASPPRRPSGTTSRPGTARPWPHTAGSGTTPNGWPRSTATWPTWPGATTCAAPAGRRWSGSTCS